MSQKFKEWVLDDSVFLSALVILVGVSSFALGKLSERPPGTVSTESATVHMTEAVETESTDYVASKNGSKYHLPWCSGAMRIKEENKLVFKSKEKAEAAGYAPADNCPGL